MQHSLGIVGILALSLASPAAAAPVAQVGAHAFPVTVSGQLFWVPYDGNQLLTEAHSLVVRAVVIIPGSARDSDSGYGTLARAASIVGMNDLTSLLVVPQFLLEEDLEYHDLPADRLYWDDSGWKEGDPSLSTTANPRPGTISSFAVLDSMLVAIAHRNPNVKSIVVAGHSAGGQFVNRFAAGSMAQQSLESRGIQVSYVVANPSTYLYLSPERVVPGTTTSFAVPSVSCSYNRYKYGLQSRNPYMAATSTAQIVAQYRQRRITYLLGQLDDDPDHPELDTSCSANVQGAHRLERGLIFRNYLGFLYGATQVSSHNASVVPGVGHDSRGIFTSSAGVAALFDVFRPAAIRDLHSN